MPNDTVEYLFKNKQLKLPIVKRSDHFNDIPSHISHDKFLKNFVYNTYLLNHIMKEYQILSLLFQLYHLTSFSNDSTLLLELVQYCRYHSLIDEPDQNILIYIYTLHHSIISNPFVENIYNTQINIFPSLNNILYYNVPYIHPSRGLISSETNYTDSFFNEYNIKPNYFHLNDFYHIFDILLIYILNISSHQSIHIKKLNQILFRLIQSMYSNSLISTLHYNSFQVSPYTESTVYYEDYLIQPTAIPFIHLYKTHPPLISNMSYTQSIQPASIVSSSTQPNNFVQSTRFFQSTGSIESNYNFIPLTNTKISKIFPLHKNTQLLNNLTPAYTSTIIPIKRKTLFFLSLFFQIILVLFLRYYNHILYLICITVMHRIFSQIVHSLMLQEIHISLPHPSLFQSPLFHQRSFTNIADYISTATTDNHHSLHLSYSTPLSFASKQKMFYKLLQSEIDLKLSNFTNTFHQIVECSTTLEQPNQNTSCIKTKCSIIPDHDKTLEDPTTFDLYNTPISHQTLETFRLPNSEASTHLLPVSSNSVSPTEISFYSQFSKLINIISSRFNRLHKYIDILSITIRLLAVWVSYQVLYIIKYHFIISPKHFNWFNCFLEMYCIHLLLAVCFADHYTRLFISHTAIETPSIGKLPESRLLNRSLKETQVDQYFKHPLLHMLRNTFIYRIESIQSLYTLGTTIGTGAEGYVKLCIPSYLCNYSKMTLDNFFTNASRRQSFFYAMKITPRRTPSIEKRFCDILPTLCSIKHPSILRHYALYQNSRNNFLLTDYIQGPELHTYVTQHKNSPMSEDIARIIFKQVLQAIQCLHQHQIIHCDIKLENFICSFDSNQAQPNIHLLDFGLACFRSETPNLCLNGTILYMAPELLLNENKPVYSLNTAADLWSAGVILYFLLSGFSPFGKGGVMKSLQRISYDTIDKYNGKIDEACEKENLILIDRDSQYIDNIIQYHTDYQNSNNLEKNVYTETFEAPNTFSFNERTRLFTASTEDTHHYSQTNLFESNSSGHKLSSFNLFNSLNKTSHHNWECSTTANTDNLSLHDEELNDDLIRLDLKEWESENYKENKSTSHRLYLKDNSEDIKYNKKQDIIHKNKELNNIMNPIHLNNKYKNNLDYTDIHKWNYYDKDLYRLNLTFLEKEWMEITQNAKELVKKLLCLDPKNRLTASEALQHPWFI